eukprot:scaffold49265_cov79-Attheya_sp.AAC.2
MAITVNTFTLYIIPVVFLLRSIGMLGNARVCVHGGVFAMLAWQEGPLSALRKSNELGRADLYVSGDLETRLLLSQKCNFEELSSVTW